MTDQALSNHFSLHRRYHRSVNLERDFDKPEVVEGYILTERSLDALQRIVSAIGKPKANRAWSMIGVYGTGKSAFAHYLTALCAPEESKIGQTAWAIAEQLLPADSQLLDEMWSHLPPEGLLRAVAVGQREPLSWTLIRALINGIESFGEQKLTPDLVTTLTDWSAEIAGNRCRVTNQQVLTFLKQLTATVKTHVLLAIDELGKNLEYAAQNRGTEDLYLLQQIAELRYKGDFQVYFLGLLHQSFAGYSERLTAIEQNEWTKIQGRFEPIQFTESPSQMTRLIGQAVRQSDEMSSLCQQKASGWFRALKPLLADHDVSETVLSSTFPLHPLTALVLPLLCTRYAQNDRSLFTFLTSDEPYGLTEFLQSQEWKSDNLPTLKLYQLYDYFVESVTGLASRINLQRWVEIQGLIQDARTQDKEVLQILKTVGILNLITATGSLKASPQLVALALCDRPTDESALKRWEGRISELQEKGIITYRSQLDELRIWEGSDFNVEAAIYDWLEKQRRLPLAQLLSKTHPLKPLIAQRHYTTTGNLRYFEQQYADSLTQLSQVRCQIDGAAGLIIYWLDTQLPENPPKRTSDGKPLIVVTTTQLDLLRTRAQHLQAIKTIQKEATELQTDGVARREVKHRLVAAERLLDDTLQHAFSWVEGQNECWIGGKQKSIQSAREFQACVSKQCDSTYHLGLVLDNELINRRELTSQGAKARRELIEAMLERFDQERLGLEGYGPEVTMYNSVLKATGIHRQEEGEWNFYPPHPNSGLSNVWRAIAQFFLEAKDKPQSIELLYQRLAAPPYGVKSGAIPVLLVAVSLHYLDEVSLYKDGTFIPVLGSEHFELLVKAPERFAVKHIEVVGLRSQVFRELEAVLRSSAVKGNSRNRNLTVLSVVKPLVQFVRKLPRYTLKTKHISREAQAVIQTLLTTQEPDELVFAALPQACGLHPIAPAEADDGTIARTYRETLVQVLREIHTAYEILLSESEILLYEAFGVRSDRTQLRLDLQFRARYLLGTCLEPMLNRFVRAAADETAIDRAWLESLLMIVADKPPEVWTDNDRTAFEVQLSDLTRRFKNLESLQKEVAAASRGGFEVRRLTITHPDGSEINQMVWMDHEQQQRIDPLVEKILAECNVPQLQQALLTRLAERVLGEGLVKVATPPLVEHIQ